jgi:hypothetical protein
MLVTVLDSERVVKLNKIADPTAKKPIKSKRPEMTVTAHNAGIERPTSETSLQASTGGSVIPSLTKEGIP